MGQHPVRKILDMEYHTGFLSVAPEGDFTVAENFLQLLILLGTHTDIFVNVLILLNHNYFRWQDSGRCRNRAQSIPSGDGQQQETKLYHTMNIVQNRTVIGLISRPCRSGPFSVKFSYYSCWIYCPGPRWFH